MCGIWASVGFDVTPRVIDSVVHRGPDDGGWEEFTTRHDRLILAHRRLAIIDLSKSSKQPLSYGNGQYWLVYNGEIYNYIEIREELEAEGFKFSSAGDSEVLLAAYARWGQDCLNKLNGMFAFVIWEPAENRLFAARDRYGIKPLYWTQNDQGVAFASEIKQFFGITGFHSRLNEDAARDFLVSGIRDVGDQTMFRNVSQIRPGECATIHIDRLNQAGGVTKRQWYAQPVPDQVAVDAREAATELRSILVDAVRLRMRSDVRLGFGLSGGLDSSSIVCGAAQVIPETELTCVSAVFQDQTIDESRYVDIIASSNPIRELKAHPDGDDLVGKFDELVYHHDLPFGSTSMFAQWCLFDSAAQDGLKVMLNGQGADEQLCGYHGAFAPFHAGMFRQGAWRTLYSEMKAQRSNHGAYLSQQLGILMAHLAPSAFRNVVRRFRDTYSPNWLNKAHVKSWRPTVIDNRDLDDTITTQMFVCGLPTLLHYEDRNSMAHGVESRLPFLDYRLVEFVVRLGAQHKIVGGETKWLLREAMADLLPVKVKCRQDKLGFETPENDWVRGALRAVVQREVSSVAERFPNMFDADSLRQYMNSVLADGHINVRTLWRIACFSVWARVFDVSE